MIVEEYSFAADKCLFSKCKETKTAEALIVKDRSGEKNKFPEDRIPEQICIFVVNIFSSSFVPSPSFTLFSLLK